MEKGELYYWNIKKNLNFLRNGGKQNEILRDNGQEKLDQVFENAIKKGETVPKEGSMEYGYTFGEFAECVVEFQAVKAQWSQFEITFKEENEKMVNDMLINNALQGKESFKTCFELSKFIAVAEKLVKHWTHAHDLFWILFPDADEVKFEQLLKLPFCDNNYAKHLVLLLLLPSRVSFDVKKDEVVFHW